MWARLSLIGQIRDDPLGDGRVPAVFWFSRAVEGGSVNRPAFRRSSTVIFLGLLLFRRANGELDRTGSPSDFAPRSVLAHATSLPLACKRGRCPGVPAVCGVVKSVLFNVFAVTGSGTSAAKRFAWRTPVAGSQLDARRPGASSSNDHRIDVADGRPSAVRTIPVLQLRQPRWGSPST